MKAVVEISPAGKYVILAAFGAVFGVLASFIFLLVYYGQQFGAPVSDGLRMRSALGITIAIILAVVLIFFRKQIFQYIRDHAPEPGDDPE